MPTYRFPAASGPALPGRPDDAARIAARLAALGLGGGALRLSRHDDAVTLEGEVADDATHERVVLAVGNRGGIARVEDRLTVAATPGLGGLLGAFAHLPPGAADPAAAEAALRRMPVVGTVGPAGSTLHEVRAGETLEAIAARHYGDTAAAGWILEANAPLLAEPGGLAPGMVLRLPPR